MYRKRSWTCRRRIKASFDHNWYLSKRCNCICTIDFRPCPINLYNKTNYSRITAFVSYDTCNSCVHFVIVTLNNFAFQIWRSPNSGYLYYFLMFIIVTVGAQERTSIPSNHFVSCVCFDHSRPSTACPSSRYGLTNIGYHSIASNDQSFHLTYKGSVIGLIWKGFHLKFLHNQLIFRQGTIWWKQISGIDIATIYNIYILSDRLFPQSYTLTFFSFSGRLWLRGELFEECSEHHDSIHAVSVHLRRDCCPALQGQILLLYGCI